MTAIRKLLIVEDDEAFARTLRRSFERRGYMVEVAASHEALTALLERFDPAYAVVDLKLGGASGLVCVQTLRAADAAMKIVVLTGFASIATAVEAIKLGASYYLAKPSNTDDIEAAFGREEGDPDAPLAGRPSSIKTVEWEHIHQTLVETDFNISETARRLGMHRRTLARKLEKRQLRQVGDSYSFPSSPRRRGRRVCPWSPAPWRHDLGTRRLDSRKWQGSASHDFPSAAEERSMIGRRDGLKIRADIVAGLAVSGLMLPEAVAYATIAGVGPGHAILAAIVGTLAYALAGRSRFAIVSATSSSAAILAASLATLPGGAGVRALFLIVAVAFAGLLFLLAWIFRLGGLTGFISHPVLRGFAFGLAITICVKQLPVLTGIPPPGGSLFHTGFEVMRSLPDWHLPSLAVGLVALAALLTLRRWPGMPGALIVLVSGVAASGLLDLGAHGVATVGRIALMPGTSPMPAFSLALVLETAQLAVPLALILLAESWGTMRALALRHGDLLDPGRELRALGLANLAAALVQGMPVGAGLSASAANEASGAQSRLAGAVAALALGALVLFAMPLVALLPQPVLAAVVIAALTHALDPRPISRLWALDRDQYIALAAALGVLLLGVLDGMLCAILLSLAALVQRFGNARLARLGRLGASHDFVDADRHPDAQVPAGIAIWRPAAPLFFANAERMFAEIARRTLAGPGTRAVVISLEESSDIDSTALDALLDFDRAMATKGFALRYARVHDRVRDLLHTAGADALVARCDYSVADAVARLENP